MALKNLNPSKFKFNWEMGVVQRKLLKMLGSPDMCILYTQFLTHVCTLRLQIVLFDIYFKMGSLKQYLFQGGVCGTFELTRFMH